MFSGRALFVSQLPQPLSRARPGPEAGLRPVALPGNTAAPLHTGTWSGDARRVSSDAAEIRAALRDLHQPLFLVDHGQELAVAPVDRR